MARTFKVVEFTLASAVADDGTTTVNYPTDSEGATLDAGAFNLGLKHRLVSNTYGELKAELEDQFDLTFGTSNITVTNRSGVSWAAGTKFWLLLDMPGGDEEPFRLPHSAISASGIYTISLGAPDTADADGVCEAQSPGAAGALTINGSLASGGVATFDVPRNVTIDSGGADDAVLTITGTDVYGNTMVEALTLNGTSAVVGKKAFKTITSVACSKAIANGAFVGSGDILGLPVFLPGAGRVLAELQDGAAATAGTIVAGDTTEPATATSGDIRGTYDPNAAADGSRKFSLVVALDDPTYLGGQQYDG